MAWYSSAILCAAYLCLPGGTPGGPGTPGGAKPKPNSPTSKKVMPAGGGGVNQGNLPPGFGQAGPASSPNKERKHRDKADREKRKRDR